MSHRDPSIVYGVATDGRMLTDLTNTGLHPMSAGQISGLNGLILGHAAQRNIPAACLLATMPVYAVSLPNPKATRAVAAALTAILGIATDFTKLDMDIAGMEKKLEAIETKLGELSLSSHGDRLVFASFLTDPEREDFAEALSTALTKAKSPLRA